MKFCVSCGTMMNDDAKYCKVCGASANNIESDKKINLEKGDTGKEETGEGNLDRVVNQEKRGNESLYSGGTAEGTESEGTENAPEYSKGRRKRKKEEYEGIKVGGIRIAGATLVSVLAVIFLLTFNIMLCVKLGISGEIVGKRVKRLNPESVVSGIYKGEEFSGVIYDSLKFGSITGSSVKGDFHVFLSKSNLTEFSADAVEDYLDYIFGVSKADPSVTADDISGFFRKNTDTFSENFGYRLTTGDLNRIEANSKGFTDKLSVERLNEGLGVNIKLLGYIFSYITLIIVFAVVLLLFIWIAIITDKQRKHITGFFGNILFTTGVLSILIPFTIIGGSAIGYSYTNELSYYLSINLLMPFCAFILCTGSFEFVSGFIIKMIRNLIVKHERKLTDEASKIKEEKGGI